MWAAKDDDLPEQLPPKIVTWESRLNNEDINAYDEMKTFLDNKRLRSREAINTKNAQIRKIEDTNRVLQSCTDFWRWLQVSLTLHYHVVNYLISRYVLFMHVISRKALRQFW